MNVSVIVFFLSRSCCRVLGKLLVFLCQLVCFMALYGGVVPLFVASHHRLNALRLILIRSLHTHTTEKHENTQKTS